MLDLERALCASSFDIFAREPSKLYQPLSIEHANVTMPEFKELALAQFPQHPIDMDRSEAEGIREIVLRERTFKAVAGDRADPFQTRGQFEEQMRRPPQRAGGS